MEKKLLLHNLSHLLLPLLIFSVAFWIMDIDPMWLGIVIFSGAFLPDIDHLKIYREYTFRNFWTFWKFCFITKRYRKSFLLFHNIPTILLGSMVLMVGRVNPYLEMFLLSFISHLILDVLFDKAAIKKLSHWKIRDRL